VANDNHAAGWVVHDAADGIRLLAVRQVELLDGLAEGKVPQLEGVVLLHAHNHVAQGAALLVGALLVEKQDRGGPSLFALRGARQRHQRLLNLKRRLGGHGSARVRALLDSGQVTNIPELDPARLVEGDNNRIVLAKGEVLAGLAGIDLERALLEQGLRVDDAVVARLEKTVLQDVRRPDEVDGLASADGEILGVDGRRASSSLEDATRGVTVMRGHGRESKAVLLEVRVLDVVLFAVLDLHPVHGAAYAGANDGLALDALVVSRRHGHSHVKNAVLGVGKDLGILAVVLSNDAQAALLGHAVGHVRLGCRVEVAVDLVELLLEARDIHDGLVTELGPRLGRVLLKGDGDPGLHGEVVHAHRRGFLLLNDNNFLLVGALPAIGNSLGLGAGLVVCGLRRLISRGLNLVLSLLNVVDDSLLDIADGLASPLLVIASLRLLDALGKIRLVETLLSSGQRLASIAICLFGEVVHGLRNSFLVLVGESKGVKLGRGRLLDGLVQGLMRMER